MKIDRVSNVSNTAARRRARAGKSDGFSEVLSSQSEPSVPASVSGGATVGPVDGLLALQEVSEDPGGRSRGRRRGEELLDRLEELRLGLLGGGLPMAALERLTLMVAEKRGKVDDPRLTEILDEIEVRAAVELAKLGR